MSWFETERREESWKERRKERGLAVKRKKS